MALQTTQVRGQSIRSGSTRRESREEVETKSAGKTCLVAVWLLHEGERTGDRMWGVLEKKKGKNDDKTDLERKKRGGTDTSDGRERGSQPGTFT